MRALVTLLASAGALAGSVGWLLEHRHRSAEAGWTFYQPVSDRYADYLSPKHSSWWPGLVGYAGLGLVVGVLIAVVMVALGFRLSRARRTAPPS